MVSKIGRCFQGNNIEFEKEKMHSLVTIIDRGYVCVSYCVSAQVFKDSLRENEKEGSELMGVLRVYEVLKGLVERI